MNHDRRKDTDARPERPAALKRGRLLTLLVRVDQRLDDVEQGLSAIRGNLLTDKTASEWLTTEEVACVLGRANFTVRQWCNQRRLRAQKTGNGREWRIHRDELQRYRRDGLLPV
jgi:excisionase family DNA binding protein